MTIKRYSELNRIDSYTERFEYLKLGALVGVVTFGFDRYINQMFYRSKQWKDIRRDVILRDNGCDMGVIGHEIQGGIVVHHMNPMEPDDIIHDEDWILNPEYLITVKHETHNAIHYGDRSLLPKQYVPRSPGDTKLW